MDKIPEKKYIDVDSVHSVKTVTSHSILYVISVVSNPARFSRRYQLFAEFCERMKKEPKIELVTVELQQGSRDFVTDATIKLRTEDELWVKECLMNIALSRLPESAEYVAFIDADIEFLNKDWVNETLHQLQCYDVVQPWSHCTDMGPKGEVLQVHLSFAYLYVNGEEMKSAEYCKANGNYFNHPGFSIAWKISSLRKIGGLLDFGILGSGDNHMIHALIGKVGKTLHPDLHENYKMLCNVYQEKCEKYIKRKLGYCTGTIVHYFHGCKRNRGYTSRWQILLKNKFDPIRHIHKDINGLYQLDDDQIQLRDDIKRYFRQRNEDDNTDSENYRYKKAHWI